MANYDPTPQDVKNYQKNRLKGYGIATSVFLGATLLGGSLHQSHQNKVEYDLNNCEGNSSTNVCQSEYNVEGAAARQGRDVTLTVHEVIGGFDDHGAELVAGGKVLDNLGMIFNEDANAFDVAIQNPNTGEINIFTTRAMPMDQAKTVPGLDLDM